MPSNDLFAGTAGHYARFRPPYPETLLHELVARGHGGGNGLVDLGCGTGELAIPLSRHFSKVLAVDADPEMIVVAKEKARSVGGGNIRWLVSRAEDVGLSEAKWDLITAGASFHWMDRALMAPRCYRALHADGAIALLGTNSAPWEPTEPWHETAAAVIRSCLGDQRRAGSQLYSVSQKHEDFLIPAGFRLEYLKFMVEQSWTPDTYLGFLYSTSYAGINVLGDAREAFERDMREALLESSPDGILREAIPFYAIIGTKS